MSREALGRVVRWSDGRDAPMVLVEACPELPLVSVLIAQRSGSSEDPAGKEGLAQLSARLMRRTAGGLPQRAVETRIDSLGASVGVDVGHSSVMLQGTTISRSLDAFVDVLIDILARPGLGEPDFRRLQRETEAELIESRDDDRTLVRRAFRRHVFEGHDYTRASGGTVRSIRCLELEDVRALVGRTLTTGNLLMAFAGDIVPERARTLAGRIAEALAQGPRITDNLGEPTVPKGRRLVIIDKPERTQTQILLGGRGTWPADEDHLALHVANTAFGGTFTARMTREIRSKRGWSYGAYSNLPFDRHRQAFSMWTFPKSDDAAACVRLQLEMLADWHARGISRKELGWAKRYLTRSHAFAVDTAAKRVGLAAEAEIYALPDGYHERYVERIQAVTLEQANQAVRTRIDPDNLLIAVVGAAQAVRPALEQSIDALESVQVIAFDAEE
ncbi:MAG: insulinase family protein [Polyangiaceae bacterium]|nr:insulinase family protein [Polyangiaceae bacterium]